MKTLDEVIEILEKVVTHDYVWFYEKTALMTIETLIDTLQYLREYQWQMTNPDGDHQQLEKAQKLLWKFYQNDPLTWDELQQMIGKPIWVEYEGYTPDWEIVEYVGNTKWKWGEVVETHLSILHKENQGKEWQAYRKERRNENIG